VEEDNCVRYLEGGKVEQIKEQTLLTSGSNLYDILVMEEVDFQRTRSSNLIEVFEIFGIEAARTILIEEMYENLEKNINIRHIELLADLMTYRGHLMQIDRHGINRSDDNGFIAKASFEEVTDIFVKAATFGEKDKMQGVSANITTAQLCPIGTNFFEVWVDEAKIQTIQPTQAPEVIQKSNKKFNKKPMRNNNTNMNHSALHAKANMQLNTLYETLPKPMKEVKESNFDIGYNMQQMQQHKLVFQKPDIEEMDLSSLDSYIDSMLSKTIPEPEPIIESVPEPIVESVHEPEPIVESVPKPEPVTESSKTEEKQSKKKKLVVRKKK
jgi:hypothetical protein